MSLLEEVARLIAEDTAEDDDAPSKPVSPAGLRARYLALMDKHTFKSGDLITWKPGLRHVKYPEDGEPGIVVEVLDPPLIETGFDSSSAYFRNPMDIIIGVILPSGDFMLFHLDSRRFMPYEAPADGRH